MIEKSILNNFEIAWDRFLAQDPAVAKFFGLEDVDKDALRSACFVFFTEGFRIGGHLFADEMQKQLSKAVKTPQNSSGDITIPV